MNCPDCNGDSHVTKTVVGIGVKQRFRVCQSCGTRWVTEETYMRFADGRIATWGVRSPREVTGNRPATHGPPARNPPATGAGGVGGGLSGDLDPILSGSGSGLDLPSDPLSRSGSGSDHDRDPDLGVVLQLVAQDGPRGKKPVKAAQEALQADFLAFWHIYPRKVAKPRAWLAWKRHTPKLDDVLAALAWQIESAEWAKDSGAFIPHPASYLNGRRWEDQKLPQRISNGATGPPRDPRVGWARPSEQKHKGGGTDHEF
jgi:hypothetical protein